jgi:hypothetical protein
VPSKPKRPSPQRALAPQWVSPALPAAGSKVSRFDVPPHPGPDVAADGSSLRVVVLVPRRAGVADRDRLWGFTRAWWARNHPDWPIYECDGSPPDEPFNRGAALNAAAAEAGEWDVCVCIDGDVLIDAGPVRSGVALAASTGHPVSAYHERVLLSPQATTRVLGGYTGDWRVRGFARAIWYHSVSSAYVVRRDLWEAVGGFDELFVGWGWEDIAFRCATETVAGVPLTQMAGSLFHLHHQKSAENDQKSATYLANELRAQRYIDARFDVDATGVLLAEAGKVRTVHPVAAPVSSTRIPRILHRTVPAETTAEVEAWWSEFANMHPRWRLETYREPLDPADWPMVGDLLDSCTSGAQRGGLIRLEALYRWGGVYVDSDCKPGVRTFDSLLDLRGFAAWEDVKVIPDAVLGCEPRHPAWAEMIHLAREAVRRKRGAWESGPGVTTKVLPGRDDVLLLPPGSFFAVNYHEPREAFASYEPEPWTHAVHQYHFSWDPKAGG